jgi:hypothetical protein
MKISAILAVLLLALLAARVSAAEEPVLGPPAFREHPEPASAPTLRAPLASPTIAYDCGNPTAAEQVVLEMINRARANPVAEGTRLGIYIHEGLSPADSALVAVKPPLAMNATLLQISRAHSQDMWIRNFFSHTNPDGLDPFQRMTAAGYSFVKAGENIAAGMAPAGLEDLLMIDSSVAGRGHRLNLLDIYSSAPYREIGVGAYSSGSPNGMGLRDFLTQDFGTRPSSSAFIVGVVYSDANSNNFYDAGEGLSGVTVMPDLGSYYAVTSSSGGYAIPVTANGLHTLTFTGGGLPGVGTKTVSVTTSGSNVKVDLKSSEAVPILHVLTVTNGIGSGSYTAGAAVAITANAPSVGQEFDRWTGDTSHIANVWAASTIYTMQAIDASVAATYRAQGATIIMSPASGAALIAGAVVQLSGSGVNLSWSYDVGSGTIAIGSGATLSFTVPSSMPTTYLLTLTLTGNNGTVTQTNPVTAPPASWSPAAGGCGAAGAGGAIWLTGGAAAFLFCLRRRRKAA